MPRRRRGASGRRPNNRRNHPSPTPASSSQCGSATEASSSARSSPPADQLASISQEIAQKLTFADRMSSKARMPPLRPGNGTVGKKCLVRANHFLVQVADRDIHHYHVTITPCAAEKIKRDVMAQVTRMYGESYLGKRIIAYDGRKSLFTAGPFPFDSKEFIVNLDQDFRASSSTGTRVERKFEVAIKLASKLDFIGLQQFLRQGHLDFHQEVIQVLCAIMRATSREKYLRVRRSFFSPHLGPKGELGDGIEFWRGFYQNLRLTQMGLSLNIDVSARGFYEPILVTDFVKKYMYTKNLSNPLSNRDLVEVKKALRGVKVALTHMEFVRSYKITGISNQPLS